MSLKFLTNLPVDKSVSPNELIAVNLLKISYIAAKGEDKSMIVFEPGFGLVVNLSYADLVDEIKRFNEPS